MYKELTEIPVPVSARFLNPSVESPIDVIQATSTSQDHNRNIKRTTTKFIFVNGTDTTLSPPIDAGDVVGVCVSPSQSLQAIFREVGSEKPKRFIEILRHSKMEASVDVTDTHRSFYSDEHLSSFSFSPQEDSLLYVAEGNQPETEDPYERFRFVPQLGEGIVGKKRPTIFILRWNITENQADVHLTALTVSPQVLLGQAIFSPEGNTIYATGYEYSRDGRLLGIKYCQNRPTGIWKLDVPSLAFGDATDKLKQTVACSAQKITPSHLSCRSPRILTNNGVSTLFWLSCPTGGAHAATTMLYSLDITSFGNIGKDIGSPLVDAVFEPQANEFPGLYLDYNLALQSSVHLGSASAPSIVTHSIWRSRLTVVAISTKNGAVTDLTPEDGNLYSWKVLNTDGKTRILCSRSTPTIPHELVLGKFNDEGKISWQVIDKPTLSDHVEKALASLRASIIPIPERHPTETIVIQSTAALNAKTTLPCITTPHGGPHSATTTSFTPATVALALEGYTISMPNYTGSLGFGENSVRALLGNCGTIDVQDCIESVRHLVSIGVSVEGTGKQFVTGGSHGGFLSAHLIGQFPDMFTASIMRNPVISAGEMSTTDIPDWYYSEFGLNYPLASSSPSAESSDNRLAPPIMNPKTFEKIHNASPISYIRSMRASVLLMIGTVDLRVAPTQGIELYHALKGRRSAAGDVGGAVEMLIFEGENHALDGVEAARVGWEAGRDFLAARRA